MKLSISMAGHRGRVRQKNEDNLYVDGLSLEQQNDGLLPKAIQLSTKEARLVGVFDGMGGYAAGERASFLAANAAAELADAYLQELTGEDLMLRICQLANERVCEEMLRGDNARIGTTASMVHLYQDRYTVCNVGDSPVFLYRDGALRMISMEHTEKANYERITGKKAPPNKKFRLTQNIGIFTDEMLIEPYCASDEIQSGDCFLLCSDGLTDMVSAEVIAEVLAGDLTVQHKVEALLKMALDNGGKDNITIVLVCAEEEEAAPGASGVRPAVLASAAALLVLLVVLLLCLTKCKGNEADPTQTTSTTESTGAETTGTEEAEPTGSETTGTEEAEPTGSETTGTEETEPTGSETTGTEETEPTGSETIGTEATEATEAESWWAFFEELPEIIRGVK